MSLFFLKYRKLFLKFSNYWLKIIKIIINGVREEEINIRWDNKGVYIDRVFISIDYLYWSFNINYG